MSLSSENMLKLMAYADGELEGDERTEAEQLLATDPDSVRFIEQLGGLGDLVELGYAAKSGKTVAKFDIADKVMSLTAAEARPAKVSSLATARQKKENKGSGAKLGVAVAVLALAASVFMVMQHRSDETPMAKAPPASPASPPVRVHDTAVQPAPATTLATAARSESGSGVDVSTVNSPGNAVSVFYLPTANELSTSVVVWVDETGEK